MSQNCKRLFRWIFHVRVTVFVLHEHLCYFWVWCVSPENSRVKWHLSRVLISKRCGQIVLSDVSFLDRSPRKARILQWKQRSEPVPAPCPAGPGGTLSCEKQQSDTTLLLGIQSQWPAWTSTGKFLHAHKVKRRSNFRWKQHNSLFQVHRW